LFLGLIALIFLFAMAPAPRPSLGAGTFDFGAHEVGTTTTPSALLPLQGSLSDLPSDTVLYNGGDPTIDLFLAQSGISAPVTVGTFIAAFGDMTFTYEITGVSLAIGNQFSADASNCIGAVSSCTVSVSFTPTTVGVHTDTVTLAVANLVVTGSSLPVAIANVVAPFVVPLLQPFLAVSITGEGSPQPESGVVLLVSARAPAPCVIVSTSTLDFGVQPFSHPGAPVVSTAFETVSNCGLDNESIHVSGTDAVGDQVPPAAWSLVDAGTNPCDVGVDKYGLIVGDGVAQLHVTTSNQFFNSLGPSSSALLDVNYQMPCDGSAGVGQVMSSALAFLATVP